MFLIGRAGASPPSRTAAIIVFFYIYLFIYNSYTLRPRDIREIMNPRARL